MFINETHFKCFIGLSLNLFRVVMLFFCVKGKICFRYEKL